MPLRAAVVGGGVVSDIHLDGLKSNPRTELVAVCDVDETNAREKAEEYDIEPYTNVEKMIHSASLDLIHICTPVQTHYEIATEAIEAGVAVLIEKPAVETVEQAEQLQQISNKNGVPVSVVHSALYGPGISKVKQSVSSESFGSIIGIDTVYIGQSAPDDEKRGSWVYDLLGGEFEEGLPHPIYVTLGLGGYPRSRADISVLTHLKEEYDMNFGYDMAQVQYVSCGGGLCNIKMTSSGKRQKIIMVHGTDASLYYDTHMQTVQVIDKDYSRTPLLRAKKGLDLSFDLITDLASNGYKMMQSKYDTDWDLQRQRNPHYEIFDKMALAVETDSDVPVPLEQAKWTTAIMEEIRESAVTKPQ